MVREVMFKTIEGRQVTAAIIAGSEGIVSGAAAASEAAGELGLILHSILEEGSAIKEGDEIARFTGTPMQISLAEESLIASMAKPSGIATTTRACAKAAGKKPKVICSAWRKMPLHMHEAIRLAITTGGALPDIMTGSSVYLDQNHIEMFGGIRPSIEAISHALEGETIVVQIQGRYASIIKEAMEAVECGAGIIFVDTGSQLDVMEVTYELDRAGLRKKVKVAFGGNVTLKDLRKLKGQDIDIVDMGSEIADAPLLDMRLEVKAVE